MASKYPYAIPASSIKKMANGKWYIFMLPFRCRINKWEEDDRLNTFIGLSVRRRKIENLF
jgi:hypothetical protein